jgi:cell division protein FtsL
MRDLTLAFPVSFTKKRAKNPAQIKILNLSLIAAILVFGLFYLFEINSLGTKGYEIQKLGQQLQQLEQDQKTLQLQASDHQSINLIQEQAQQLNFVPATSVTYLKNSDYALK